MACSFSPSSAARLQAVDATAAASMKNARVPLNLKASVSPAQRSLGGCRAARQEGATQDPSVSVGSPGAVTSPTSDGTGLENGTPAEPRQHTTIRKQLTALVGDTEGELTLPLGKKLKEGLKSLNSLTVSQRRNIKRQTLLTKVSGRNDSVFFATVGAFVLVPPFAILAIAVLTGYVQLLP